MKRLKSESPKALNAGRISRPRVTTENGLLSLRMMWAGTLVVGRLKRYNQLKEGTLSEGGIRDEN